MKAFRDECVLIENQLALWVGGDLDVELRARVDQHLAQCERCADNARALDGARQALIVGLRSRETRAPALWPSLEPVLREEGRFAASSRAAASVPIHAAALVPIADASALAGASTSVRPAWRKARLWTRIGISAAAAVMLGFMLGRSASDAPQSPPLINLQPTRAAVAESAGHEIAVVPKAPASGVVPVANNGCLRRLAPGEARLSDDAESFSILEERFFPRPGGNGNVGAPASLQSVTRH